MKTCSHPDGCTRPVVARGWCNAHYLRVAQSGDPGGAAIERRRREPEACSVEGCTRPRAKREWCGTHYERWRTHGDVTISLIPRGNPDYLAMHKQIYRRKGPARNLQCVKCGQQARQWAYDHSDRGERKSTMMVRGNPVELTYSVNPDHYMALCVSCHVRFDQAVPA